MSETETPTPENTPERRKSRKGRNILIAIIGIFAIIGISQACSGGADETPAAPAGQVSPEPEATEPEAEAPEEAEEPVVEEVEEPAEPEAEPEPTFTVAQEQAIAAAESYLDTGAFSKQGLIDQLTSEYGNGFDPADAKFAVKHVDPDWKAEAVEAAESYLDMGGFSRASLIDQLTSEYGDQFTHEQAEHAANEVGL